MHLFRADLVAELREWAMGSSGATTADAPEQDGAGGGRSPWEKQGEGAAPMGQDGGKEGQSSGTSLPGATWQSPVPPTKAGAVNGTGSGTGSGTGTGVSPKEGDASVMPSRSSRSPWGVTKVR